MYITYNHIRSIRMNGYKNIMGTIILIMTLVSSFLPAQGNESTGNSKTRYAIEIDPAAFVFNGYAFHIRVQPEQSDHILLGAGIYAMDFPDLIIGFNSKNKDKGWNVRLNQGIGLFGEYHFSEINRNFFAGVQLAVHTYKIRNEKIAGSGRFNTFLGMGYGGYTFKPFENNGFYIKTWMGVGYTTKTGGENRLDRLVYDISPVLFFAAVHLGYMF